MLCGPMFKHLPLLIDAAAQPWSLTSQEMGIKIFPVMQDFAVPSKLIMQQWTARKLSDEQVQIDLLESRCPRAPAMLTAVTSLIAASEKFSMEVESQRVLAQLEKTLRSFRSLPCIDGWLANFDEHVSQPRFRTQCLLLRGASRTGKTQKALSFFGYQRTLVVNCQGLGTNLPCLRSYDRSKHRAIVFDEIDEGQVLANKLVFQAGPWLVKLSQSVCNQHSYSKWFYGCAMILCSNTFRMSSVDGLHDVAAIDWLQTNIVDAQLPDGCTWFIQDSDADKGVSV